MSWLDLEEEIGTLFEQDPWDLWNVALFAKERMARHMEYKKGRPETKEQVRKANAKYYAKNKGKQKPRKFVSRAAYSREYRRKRKLIAAVEALKLVGS